MEKKLHIISFNVPYPADYGGVYDVFYKLVALHQEAVKIHLHCFDYGRAEQPELSRYCESVTYYHREMGHKAISCSLPYIVASRRNDALIQNLLKDDHPIFMEGIHCTYPLLDSRFKNRNCFVRLHNVEYQYYRDLFKSCNSPIKKLYYWNESRLLRCYEAALAKSVRFLGITEKDEAIYRNEFGCKNIDHLPLFIPNWEISCEEGMGNYCLYHGDLSVPANEKAAFWLLEKVFHQIKLPLVIAGKNPSEKLIELSHQQRCTCIVANPSEKEMQDMISKAHINVLPSFTSTGIKVKLVNALFHGRHCVVNDATIEGSGLGAACYCGTTAQSFQRLISQLYHQPFTKDEILGRKKLLQDIFNNTVNAKKLIEMIWGS